jgi:hypothetical protein
VKASGRLPIFPIELDIGSFNHCLQVDLIGMKQNGLHLNFRRVAAFHIPSLQKTNEPTRNG